MYFKISKKKEKSILLPETVYRVKCAIQNANKQFKNKREFRVDSPRKYQKDIAF